MARCSMTHAIVLTRVGGPEVLEWQELPDPAPNQGELCVRHTAVGVNFVDIYQRSGLYPLPLPSRLGQEAVGVIEQVGASVVGFAIGDRVAYVACLGAYAERHVIPAERAIKIPADIRLDDVIIAASLLKGMTAEFLIHRAYRVEPGQWVVWHAAAGGTGLLACQWLTKLGANVIGTVGSDAKAELARGHGCREVIVYTRENFVERVRELTHGAGVPVVFDSVGASTFVGSLNCLSPRGTLVSFGNASGKPSLPDVTLLAAKGSLYLTRPTLSDYTRTRSERLASAHAVFDVLSSGAVRPVIGQTLPLFEVADAHRALEARATTGSTVLVPTQRDA